MTTYAITFAWRNIEDGELGPEFIRTQDAMSTDQAVEIATTEIEMEQRDHPDFGWMEPINDLELRGVTEISAENRNLSLGWSL